MTTNFNLSGSNLKRERKEYIYYIKNLFDQNNKFILCFRYNFFSKVFCTKNKILLFDIKFLNFRILIKNQQDK